MNKIRCMRIRMHTVRAFFSDVAALKMPRATVLLVLVVTAPTMYVCNYICVITYVCMYILYMCVCV